jgi:hypothetical protein
VGCSGKLLLFYVRTVILCVGSSDYDFAFMTFAKNEIGPTFQREESDYYFLRLAFASTVILALTPLPGSFQTNFDMFVCTVRLF